MYDTSCVSNAMSSSGYKVYSSFGHSSYFWGVQHEIAWDKDKCHTMGKMMAGGGQIAAKIGSFHVMAIWLHAIHVDEMQAWCDQGFFLGCDFFQDNIDYEISHGHAEV